jgi:hypothetical protein
MKSLNLVKMGVATALLVFGPKAVTTVNAANNLVPNGTYVFQSTDGDAILNGSTVTFNNNAIVSWDLLDASVGPGVDLPPLTPANSSIISDFIFGQTQYGPDGWFFTIGSPVGTSSTQSSIFWFEAQNDLFGPGTGGGEASLYAGFGNGPSQDPAGNWVLEGGSSDAQVPDASSTFLLCAGAMATLLASRSFLSRRAAKS